MFLNLQNPISFTHTDLWFRYIRQCIGTVPMGNNVVHLNHLIFPQYIRDFYVHVPIKFAISSYFHTLSSSLCWSAFSCLSSMLPECHYVIMKRSKLKDLLSWLLLWMQSLLRQFEHGHGSSINFFISFSFLDSCF